MYVFAHMSTYVCTYIRAYIRHAGKGATLVQIPANTTSGQQLEVRYPLAQTPPQPPHPHGLISRGQMRSVTVVIPPGVLPGQQLQVRVEHGSMLVTVPAGASPGQHLDVRYWIPENQNAHAPTHSYPPYARSFAGSGGAVAQSHAHWSSQRWVPPPHNFVRGRPPATPPKPPLVRAPQLPPQPSQLSRRLILTSRSKHVARTLAAQYNVSLYMINSDAVEFAHILAPRMSRGKPPSDLVMAMVWQLCAQMPARAVVLVDIVNETLANKISKSMQYSGRYSARPACSWEHVDNISMSVNETILTPAGKDYAWRYHAGEWGWYDPDTLDKVDTTLMPANRTVAAYLPSPPVGFTWLRIGTSWIAVTADDDSPPPSAMMLYRQAVKDEVIHGIESRRRASEAVASQMKMSSDLRGNATECLNMLQDPSPDPNRLAQLVSPHPRLAHCLLTLGWNAVFRRFDFAPDVQAATRAIKDLLSTAVVDDAEDNTGDGKRKGSDKTEVNKIMSDMWANLAPATRELFENAAADLAGRYQAMVGVGVGVRARSCLMLALASINDRLMCCM
jgi:hypothetical protein